MTTTGDPGAAVSPRNSRFSIKNDGWESQRGADPDSEHVLEQTGYTEVMELILYRKQRKIRGT